LRGIGQPGSPEARLWHEIAARNGVVCPYGPRDRAEWNHCQPTSLKMIVAQNPLRETVSAAGPLDLETMFEAGNEVIVSMASAADSLSRAAPPSVRALEAGDGGTPKSEVVASRRMKRSARRAITLVAAKPVAAKPVAAKPVRHARTASRARGA